MGSYAIYCDESCHLEHDGHDLMTLGAVWCPVDRVPEISARLLDIKRKHSLNAQWECKWVKSSRPKIQFYLDVIDYFFDDDDLRFRGVVARGKHELDHHRFQQDHDTWYYKMFFLLLSRIVRSRDCFRVYLDLKDTHWQAKATRLRECLSNARHDFDMSYLHEIQAVRSHQVPILQIADVLTGALSYASRELSDSEAKLAIIERIRRRSGFSLTLSTMAGEQKFNIFHWNPQQAGEQ